MTHSTLWLDWDAAPGPVSKYLITYQPEEGEAKEVSFGSHAQKTKLGLSGPPVKTSRIHIKPIRGPFKNFPFSQK